jgi:hypothetical protein
MLEEPKKLMKERMRGFPVTAKNAFTTRVIELCNASTEDTMRRGNIILVIDDVGQPGP